MKIYVIHYNKLKDRKTSLIKQIKRENLKVNWFIQKDKYGSKTKKKYYVYSYKIWLEKLKYLNKLFFEQIPRKLTQEEVYLAINHIKIYNLISKESNFSLILEDDVILPNNFFELLDLSLKKLKNKNWDICYLDWCKNFEKNYKSYEIIKDRPFDGSWGTAAYLITPSCAKKLKNIKFTFPIDQEIEYLKKKLKLNIYWIVPPLIIQKSSLKLCNSSLLREKQFSFIYNFFILVYFLYSEIDKILGKIGLFLKKRIPFLYHLLIKMKKIIFF